MYQTGPILVHIYPLIYMGTYMKYMVTAETKMSANADLIQYLETYVQQGKTIENQFFIYGPKCDFFTIFSYLRGPEGPSMIRLGLSCVPAILPPISMYMWNKEAIW